MARFDTRYMGSALWTSRLGRWLFRVASRRLTPHAAPTGPVTAGERGPLTLLAGLPKPLKRQLRGVEPRIRHLEASRLAHDQREAELRAALAEVSRDTPSGSGASDGRRQFIDDLTTVRQEVVERRDAIVASLERVRLELLRLKSGLGGAERVRAEVERGVEEEGKGRPLSSFALVRSRD
jgi:hypothetical protein